MVSFRRSIVLAALLVAAPVAALAQTTDDFFNPAVIHRIDLWVNSDDWEKLKQNFQENTYYPADFVWNGLTVRNTGVRSRGFGSRSGTKPGIRVDMDRYTTSQEFLGLKSFILDNLVQDPSAIHETTAMRVFERLGIPASREAHCRLYVNGEYAGLYAMVESVDKSFLARIFGEINGDTQNDGYLYEYEYTDRWLFNYFGADLDAYKTRFDAKTHESQPDETKWRRIEELVRLANELPSDRFLAELDPRLDLRAFVRYVAAQNFVGQNDGFLGYDGMNNFYFYRKENSEQHVFIAWDEDNAFWGPDFPLDMRHNENTLFRKAMEVPELRDVYYATLAEAARVTQETGGDGATPWLEHEIRTRLDMIRSALEEDTKKPYSMSDHDFHRAAMIQFATGRAPYVESNLPQ